MFLARILPALALLLLAACFPVAPQVPMGPSYYVMRHLEKAPTGADPGLSAEGQRQAALLPDWFAADRPVAIYVSNTARARQTAAPLAEAYGITPKVYDPADTAGLVRMVQTETGGSVLVVGHSNTVPDIVALLGGTRPAPIADNQYGDIWHISPATGSTLQLRLGG